eukprot:6201376-Pleurochrysis_carterae.AAC.4
MCRVRTHAHAWERHWERQKMRCSVRKLAACLFHLRQKTASVLRYAWVPQSEFRGGVVTQKQKAWEAGA